MPSYTHDRLFLSPHLVPQHDPTATTVAMAAFTPTYDGSRHSYSGEDCSAAINTHANNAHGRVQPTNNPYHWEIRGTGHSNISTWVKASWSRTNEIVRGGAGAYTLKRNSAIRRYVKGHAALDSDARTILASYTSTAIVQNTVKHSGFPLRKLKLHRRFSFKTEDQCNRLSMSAEECEEEARAVSETATRVDSRAEQHIEGRCTGLREEMDERPRVARTFSEILEDPFVPTALMEA